MRHWLVISWTVIFFSPLRSSYRCFRAPHIQLSLNYIDKMEVEMVFYWLGNYLTLYTELFGLLADVSKCFPSACYSSMNIPIGANEIIVNVCHVTFAICLGCGGVYYVQYSSNGSVPPTHSSFVGPLNCQWKTLARKFRFTCWSADAQLPALVISLTMRYLILCCSCCS